MTSAFQEFGAPERAGSGMIPYPVPQSMPSSTGRSPAKAGFVQVEDDGRTLLIPDRRGNNRIDTISEPMVRRIRDEFHIGTRAAGKGDVVRLNYLAVSTDQRGARLTVRDRESDSRSEIPAGSWEFVDRQSIRLLPLGKI